MIFIETTGFTKRLADYLKDNEYRELQNFLIEQPEAGDLIQGTGGLRKLRWSMDKRGKSGGIRVIYYINLRSDHIYFFTLYAKNEVSDLSASEKNQLKRILENWQP